MAKSCLLPTPLLPLSCVFMALDDGANCPHFPEGETEALRGSSSLWAFNESLLWGGLGMLGAGTESQRPSGTATSTLRKSEAPGAFQARDEGRSQRPSQGQSQLRRQSSPAPSRQVSSASHQPSPYPGFEAGVQGREVLCEKGRAPAWDHTALSPRARGP